MSFNYVYVLTSDEEDFYADQAAISIYSLKKKNPESHVIVITDKKTMECLPAKGGHLESVVDEFVVKGIPVALTRYQRSRYLKTSCRKWVKGDYIFLDTDTIIMDSLHELESKDCMMGAVLLQDSFNWNRNNPHYHIKKYNKSRELPENYNYGIENFYNSGVMLCRDTPEVHNLYNRWHERWLESSSKYDFNMDQSDLWITDVEQGTLITPIEGQYNFMTLTPEFSMIYFSNCKIFHYFSNSPKMSFLKVKTPEFLLDFRKKGFDEELNEMIENIRKEYLGGLVIEDKQAIEKRKEKEKLKKIERKTTLEVLGRNVSYKFPWLEKMIAKVYKKN